MHEKHPLKTYAGRNGAGQLKVGRTTSVTRRQRELQCADPGFQVMYTVDSENLTESELLHKIRSMGFRVGRSREVFDMSLVLVSSIMSGGTPDAGKPPHSLLQAFLDIEVLPGLSLEDACYPASIWLRKPVQPRPDDMLEARKRLYSAGLVHIEEDLRTPGYVLIHDPLKFAQAFPHMKHVIPLVLHCGGVRLVTAAPLRELRPQLAEATKQEKDAKK